MKRERCRTARKPATESSVAQERQQLANSETGIYTLRYTPWYTLLHPEVHPPWYTLLHPEVYLPWYTPEVYPGREAYIRVLYPSREAYTRG